MRRHRLAVVVIGWGYLIGLAFLPRLPGPYWTPARSGITAALLAFTLPTTAATICLLLDRLWRHEKAGTAGPTGNAVFVAITLRIVVFVVAIHTLLLSVLAGVLPRTVNGGRIVLLLLGVVIVLIGDLLPRVRRNHVIGIRTARTMRDPYVWARTHRTAGYAMVGLGVILSVAAVIAPGPVMPAIVLPVAAIGMAAVVLVHRQHVLGRIE
jgi:uncharacterized membrane protein